MKNLKNKRLVIFDFDETLCETGAMAHVTKSGSFTKSLTPGEYSDWRETGEYDLDPTSWELDFSEFRGLPQKGKPISDTMLLMKHYISSPDHSVAIVTGRDELGGVKEWLQLQSVDLQNIILMCSGSPNKRYCYESLFNTLEPESVIIFEDGMPYISQCAEICNQHDLHLSSFLVKDQEVNHVKNSTENC